MNNRFSVSFVNQNPERGLIESTRMDKFFDLFMYLGTIKIYIGVQKSEFLMDVSRYLIDSIVKLAFKELLNKEQIGNSKPFTVTNLPVYLINSEQIGITEQFCDDQKVPFYQVRLY